MYRFLWLLVPALVINGCYSFSTNLPGHIKTVMVPVFQNETLIAEIPEELTAALTERLIADNQVRVVQSNPDAVLDGVITHYEDRVATFDSQKQADEYIVVLTVDLVFRDRVNRKDIWREEEVRGFASYLLTGADPEQASSAEEARAFAIEQIVDIAMSRTFEGW